MMLLKLSINLALAAVLIIAGHAPTLAAPQPPLFNTEQQAQQHCPTDTVVWFNLPSGIYHFKGQHWYGRTKSGAYVCRKEADQSGDRATRNGQ